MKASRTPMLSIGWRSRSAVITARKIVAEGNVYRRAVVDSAGADLEKVLGGLAGGGGGQVRAIAADSSAESVLRPAAASVEYPEQIGCLAKVNCEIGVEHSQIRE